MNEKPIILSTPMVKAILSDNGIITRIPIKPQPKGNYFDGIIQWSSDKKDIGKVVWKESEFGAYSDYIKCPYAKGDYLWVKEAIKKFEYPEFHEEIANNVILHEEKMDGIAYVADDEPAWDITRPCEWVWEKDILSSMCMPRSLARIFLKVTSVKVELVQDIWVWVISLDRINLWR